MSVTTTRIELSHRAGPASPSGRFDGVTDSGAVPVVHDSHVSVEDRSGVRAVSIDGGLDSTLAARVAATVSDALSSVSHVLVDLDRVALLDSSGIDSLLKTIRSANDDIQVALVTGRLSGRLVLERWGVTRRHPVFGSVADALQAKILADAGYGDGWAAAGR